MNNMYSGGMNVNRIPMNWNGMMPPYQQPQRPQLSPIPVRVVFSPEQISPQEIPTNGTPAIFPLNDGSRIIVKSLLPSGDFGEMIYVPEVPTPVEPQPQSQIQQPQAPQINPVEEVSKRLEVVEERMNKILSDLYGNKNEIKGGDQNA